MFKRVEKRRRRKEEEEELGLDDDMKEVLGVQDTDSDESESDSDSETDSEKGSAIGEQEVDREVDEEDEEEATGSEGDISNDEGELENPVITVEDALADPVYLVSLDPDVKACLVCPGKSLKHPKMIEVHKASAAHRRRFASFVKVAAKAGADDNAWDILEKKGNTSKNELDKQSRRAEKRKVKLGIVKLKRDRRKEAKEKTKAKQKERAAASSQTADQPKDQEPVKKKRKLDQEGKSKRKQHQPPPRIRNGEHKKDAKYKRSTEGHKQGEIKSKRDKSQPKGDRKKGRQRADGGVLKIID